MASRTKSTAVAVAEEVPVPALATATSITAEDIAIPTLYIGHRASHIVEQELAKAGDLYAAQNQDDNDPVVLWKQSDGGEGLLFYPIAMFKSWSWSPGPGSPLELWPFEARGKEYPDGPPLDDPDPKKRARLVYNYLIMVPEFDTELPLKLRLTGTSTPAAQKMNMPVLRENRPFNEFAYRLTTIKREKTGVSAWYIAQVKSAETTPEHLAAAEALASMTAPLVERLSQRGASDDSDKPSI